MPRRSGLLTADSAVASAVGRLASPVTALPPDTDCERVRAAFLNDSDLFALPIVDRTGKPIGLVNRFKFLERLASPFGRGQVAKKPVSAFMEANPLVVDFQTSVDELGIRLLDDGHRHVLDGFIVTKSGKYAGLGTGLDIVRALTERRQKELQRQALHDMLTGLPNRAWFEEALVHALTTAEDKSVALLFVDLDRFKQINDTYGYQFGDRALCALSQRMRGAVRPSDMVARLSGDEFAVIVPCLTSVAEADAVARGLLASCRVPLSVDGHAVVISCSIGVALYPQHADNKECLLRAADAAQYSAKELRNTWRRYTPDLQASNPPLPSLGALRRALETETLDVHYQPVFDLPEMRVHGVEALVRWTHDGVAVPATEVVRLAEDSGLTVALTEFIMRTAMRQMSTWDCVTGQTSLKLAVNVSAAQIHDGGLVATIDRLSRQTGFDPRRLDIELTERAAVRASASAHATLHALRARGVTLTLDDFGTGYSALSRLDRLPIDVVKIDKSFLEPVSEGGDSVIARAIIGMARAVGMRTVGEGVETERQLEFLKRERCDSAQGFLLARPMAAGDLARLLTANVGPITSARVLPQVEEHALAVKSASRGRAREVRPAARTRAAGFSIDPT